MNKYIYEISVKGAGWCQLIPVQADNTLNAFHRLERMLGAGSDWTSMIVVSKTEDNEHLG